MFDVSHMGRFRLSGPRALDYLQYAVTNDVASLGDGTGQYTLLLEDDGGVLDDLILYRLKLDEFLLVVNAANAARDYEVLSRDRPDSALLFDATEETAMIAVQGPSSREIVAELAGDHVLRIERFHVGEATIAGHAVLLCRTGYTGEDGFEIVAEAHCGAAIWRALLAAGVTPCGLGARDTLRIEAGYPLYGHEIHEQTTPVEAGLMWAVKLAKGPFRGRQAVLSAKQRGPERKLMGVIMAGRMIPRQGCRLLNGSERVGEVTSGTFSPTRGCGLGIAYVRTDIATPGTEVAVEVRGASQPATLVRKTELLGRQD